MFLDEYQLIRRALNRICIVLITQVIITAVMVFAVLLS
jgi:hypothetical protein